MDGKTNRIDWTFTLPITLSIQYSALNIALNSTSIKLQSLISIENSCRCVSPVTNTNFDCTNFDNK